MNKKNVKKDPYGLTDLKHISNENYNDVNSAAKILSEGGIILYPTDTIWGIGCDATNYKAISKVYAIKKRLNSKAMLVLIDSLSMLSRYVKNIPDKAIEIIHSTKKPLTVIYPEAQNLPENIIARDESIGIRLTNDDFCRRIIALLGKPIVSTSANISGQTSPANFMEISPQIINSVDYVVRWRQDDLRIVAPSPVIKINKDNQIEIIRN